MIESFNVLRDPWIPVWREGKRALVSYVDLLAGQAEECEDVAHSRDEFRAFAHGLLAALTQALFEPRTIAELEERIDEPLPLSVVRAKIDAVAADFDLLGEPGFMQWGPRSEDNVTEAIVHEWSETYRPALSRTITDRAGICPACAAVAIYGFQAFAPAGGRGISPGVRGTPPLTTFVRLSNLRKTTWANVLVSQGSGSERYPADPARPWAIGPEKLSKDGRSYEQLRKPSHEIGLVEGLFWKPRVVRLGPCADGGCGLCGAIGPRVSVVAFRAGAKKEDGYWSHPLTPSREEKGERRTQHVPTEKPVWTGLADMLSVSRTSDAKTKEAGGLSARAAPVVFQWINDVREPLQLMVFAYRFDNASMEGRFFQVFPALSAGRTSQVSRSIAAWVEQAESVLALLRQALKRAYSERLKSNGSFFAEDARVEFWRRSEPAFWTAVRAMDASDVGDASGAGEASIDPSVIGELSAIARSIFDANTEAAALEARHQALVARARRSLIGNLFKLREGNSKRTSATSAEGGVAT